MLENLFSMHTPTRTFDLKGIATRVAKPSREDQDASAVLWDSEWIKFSNIVLVHPHSKRIISDALANDTAFLAKSGIMDYSALLGVSDEQRYLILGLIDVLGSFNLAKMVEYRAKATLRSADTVTVLPVRMPPVLSASF